LSCCHHKGLVCGVTEPAFAFFSSAALAVGGSTVTKIVARTAANRQGIILFIFIDWDVINPFRLPSASRSYWQHCEPIITSEFLKPRLGGYSLSDIVSLRSLNGKPQRASIPGSLFRGAKSIAPRWQKWPETRFANSGKTRTKIGTCLNIATQKAHFCRAPTLPHCGPALRIPHVQ
jgi:hypothetical protein